MEVRMAKIRGIVLEKVMHESEGEEVLRLTRDVTVHVERGDGLREIVMTFQSALGQVLPFIANGKQNCTKRASATIVIEPISGEVMYEVARTLKSRITVGGFREWHQYELAVDATTPGSITVVILTPFPNYPVWSVHKSGPSVAPLPGGRGPPPQQGPPPP